jgi:hypothetical protein
MLKDRSNMLKQFLQNDMLLNLTSLTEDQLSQVSFSNDSGDLMIESLKKLLMAYCGNESTIMVLRKINLYLSTEVIKNDN